MKLKQLKHRLRKLHIRRKRSLTNRKRRAKEAILNQYGENMGEDAFAFIDSATSCEVIIMKEKEDVINLGYFVITDDAQVKVVVSFENKSFKIYTFKQ